MNTLTRRMLLSFTATLTLIVSTQASVPSSYAGRLLRKEAAMSNSGGKITAPVSIEDVCQVLGVTTRDVGYLCSNQHGKINMWSKCKPVIVNDMQNITQEQLKAAAYGLQWYQSGDSLTYSIKYLPPVGDTNWKRLTDFVGYNHAITSGLGWKNTAITKDLISNYSDLTLYIENDSNKITVYDLKDTMFNGCKLQMNCISRAGTSIYTYSEVKDITQDMSFTIPISSVKKFGIGEFSAILRILPPNYTTGIQVLTYDICVVNITADTGLTVNGWTYNTAKLKAGSAPYLPANQFHTGVTSGYLALSNKNLLIDGITVVNRSGKTFTQEDLKICTQWTDSNGIAREYYSYIYKETANSWSVPNGSATTFVYKIDDTQLPKYTDTTTGYIHVKMFLVFKVNIGGVYSNVRISDVFDLNIARNNGAIGTVI